MSPILLLFGKLVLLSILQLLNIVIKLIYTADVYRDSLHQRAWIIII